MSKYLTAGVPGTGGVIREDPDDFFVEEIPLYTPSGHGEHLYLTVEKRGMTTFDLLKSLSRALKVRERDLGYAGLKDARAVTRQTVSIPGVKPKDVEKLEISGVTVLDARLHGNKLRPGHLAGNRFRLRIRQVFPVAFESARESLKILQQRGVPNRFGMQRYGASENSHLVGKALLREDYAEASRQVVGDPEFIRNERWRRGAELFRQGDLSGALDALPPRFRNERNLIRDLSKGKSHRDAVLSLPRNLLRLCLSAYQSSLFDRIVTSRLHALDTLWEGDLAFKHANGACFLVEDPERERGRLETFEISPTAPLFGRKVLLAEGRAGVMERKTLADEELLPDVFERGDGLAMEGERRPMRVALRDPELREDGGDIVVSFALPKGSYATAVLEEIMKP